LLQFRLHPEPHDDSQTAWSQLVRLFCAAVWDVQPVTPSVDHAGHVIGQQPHPGHVTWSYSTQILTTKENIDEDKSSETNIDLRHNKAP
tara:strand:+ start:225 stop:491 length:267 start_codon:yes stop_codon:yes gene_type:complete